MTLAEIERAVEAKKKILLLEARERAAADYLLADLIGKSISRIYSEEAKLPEIYEVYPDLFNKEEMERQRREQKNAISAMKFKQFATSHNKKLKEEVAKEVE